MLGHEAVANSGIASVLEKYQASIRPLFPAAPPPRPNLIRRLVTMAMPFAAPPSAQPPRTYHRIVADDSRLNEIAAELGALKEVIDAAYVKPAAEPAVNMMGATGAPAPPGAKQDFTPRQKYLEQAPGGIDAQFAWTQPGGKGAGVKIIDVEGEWRLTHEDLLINKLGLLGGTPPNDIGWRNHGTAVIGTFSASENAFGVTGICPAATVGVVSIFGDGRTSSLAIREAADKLAAGDILLIELHRPGPRNSFEDRDDQLGYIAVEWWPDDYDAIHYAIGRGVIVVEAAGNGAENFDDALYDTPDKRFPADWKNPFRRGDRDSGAILVGAGAPPQNTHGNDNGPDRSRLDFSNYGSAVDAQGWGREVTSCGYGDLQGGANEDQWYTDQFSGTSSASPVVVGALGCAQGTRRAAGSTLLTPSTARALLRATGSPQQDGPAGPKTQRIGNRPDLRQILAGPAVA
jgi:Subtilase family